MTRHFCITGGNIVCSLISCQKEENVSHFIRKPVFRVSDQIPHIPGCTAKEDGYRLKILDLGSMKKNCHTVLKTSS